MVVWIKAVFIHRHEMYYSLNNFLNFFLVSWKICFYAIQLWSNHGVKYILLKSNFVSITAL